MSKALRWILAACLWSLGLARYLGEALYLRPLFSSPLAVGGMALAGGGVGLLLWRALAPRRAGAWVGLLLPLAYLLSPQPDPLMGLVLLAGGAGLTLFLAWGPGRRWAVLLLALVVLGLYLRTMGQAVGEADTFEFQVVAPALGIAHPTGYPLYILLGKLFSLLPFGSVAWRVNMTSAVFGTGAVVLFHELLGRVFAPGDDPPSRPQRSQRPRRGIKRALFAFRRKHPAAVMHPPEGGRRENASPASPGGRAGRAAATHLSGGARRRAIVQGGVRGRATDVGGASQLLVALAFAFSRVFWSQTVVAEVYALNLLFVSGLLLLATTVLEGRGGRRVVWRLALLSGLSLTNHLTTVLLFPALVLILLLARPRMEWWGWLGCGLLFLLGLSLYAYIPLRWPALHDGRWMRAGEFLAYVTGQQFGGALQPALLRDPTRYAIVGRMLLEPFGWVGVMLAVVGLGWLGARRPRLALVSGLAFLAYAFYGLIYLVPDISVFLLPAHLILALWMGVGVGTAALGAATSLLLPSPSSSPTGRGGEGGRGGVKLLSSCLIALFALLPLSRIWLNLPVVDQSGRVEAERWGRYVLSLPIRPGAAILADGEKFAPLYYLQQVEGLRPDLDLVVHFTEEEYRADLAARLAAGQTVYLARYLPHLESFHLRSLGPLVEVGTEPRAEPPPGAETAGATLGPVELMAFDLELDPQGRSLYHLTLYWRAAAVPREDLEVRLRLVDGAGEVAWVSDGVRPVGRHYPTNGWPPGAVVADYHPVPIPPWLPPGSYSLEVALFPRFSEQGVAADGGDIWWGLAQVEVEGGEPGGELPHRVQILLEKAWLMGYDLPAAVPAGSPVAVDLAWAGVEDGGAVRLEWVDEAGQAVGRAEGWVAPGVAWSRVWLAAPDVPGTYRLRVGCRGWGARCRWLARPTDGCVLAAVEVGPSPGGLADFDGRMLLVAAAVGAERLRPGEVLPVTLRWRALRMMEEDYTVTVQLLGPDGRLHGQVDSWPVQGTLPTSQWKPGQEITDPYQVLLAPEAPPGRYRVIVGVYLLATMERLPVVGEGGAPVADHVVVGEIELTAGMPPPPQPGSSAPAPAIPRRSRSGGYGGGRSVLSRRWPRPGRNSIPAPLP
ncbi:MAG TPA: DUF2723 domain-containing protein [Anaerolineales bacterium]|nr:DUF2723 domain-containing protein [Anaerolineales bacterium]